MKLTEFIEQLFGKEESDSVRDTLSYGYKTYGDHEVAFVDGYTGEEGGPTDVNFICRIDDHYFQVHGYHDSWNGGETFWDQATYLGQLKKDTRFVKHVETYWKDKVTGKVVWSSDDLKKVDTEDSWE
jgi:hypothetical protein